MKKIANLVKIINAVKFYVFYKILKRIAPHNKKVLNYEFTISIWSGVWLTLKYLLLFYLFFPLNSIQQNKKEVTILALIIFSQGLVFNLYFLYGHRWLKLVNFIRNKPEKERKRYLNNAKFVFWFFLTLLISVFMFRIIEAKNV